MTLKKAVIASIAFATLLGMHAKADAQQNNATFVVSYIEALPTAVEKTSAILREMGKASKAQEGNQEVQILENIYRPQQFVVLEKWNDAAAQIAHAADAKIKNYRDELQPLLTAPYNEILANGLLVGNTGPLGKNALYAVTHFDIIPPKKDDGIAAAQKMAEQSRQDNGNERLDVLQVAIRPNHLTFIEVWRDRKALEGHESENHVKDFRNTVQPWSGGLYDQRLFKPVSDTK